MGIKIQAGGAGLASSNEAKERRRFNRVLIESTCSSMEFGEAVLHFLELTGLSSGTR